MYYISANVCLLMSNQNQSDGVNHLCKTNILSLQRKHFGFKLCHRLYVNNWIPFHCLSSHC